MAWKPALQQPSVLGMGQFADGRGGVGGMGAVDTAGSKMKSKPWIVAHDATKGVDAMAMECLRCRAKQRFTLPIGISVWCAAAKAFEVQHAQCKAEPCPHDTDGDGNCPRCARTGVPCRA